MRWSAIVIVFAVLVAACSSGISQEEFDAAQADWESTEGSLEADIGTLTDEVADLEQQLADAIAEADGFLGELDTTKTDLETSNQEASDLEDRVTDLNEELATALADLEAAEAALLASSAADDGEGFSQFLRDEYMSGCEPEAGEPFCTCSLDELEKVMTEAEFLELSVASVTGDPDEIPDEVLTAILACVHLIDE